MDPIGAANITARRFDPDDMTLPFPIILHVGRDHLLSLVEAKRLVAELTAMIEEAEK